MGPIIRNVIRDVIRPVMGDEALVSRFSGLLDLYPGAAVAYSLARLSASTTNVVRVRRSSDDAEQDFTAEQVADGTLTAFCGSSDGWVRTLYDQSGNNRHGHKITASGQLKIVAAGSLITMGGVPVIERTTTSQEIDVLYDLRNISNASLYLTHNTSSSTGGLLNSYDPDRNNNDFLGLWQEGSTSELINSSIGTPTIYTNGSAFTDTTRDDMHAALATGNDLLVSAVEFNTAAEDYANGINVWRYRQLPTISFTSLGKLGDFILFDNSNNRADIEAEIAGRYGITI